jgi:hypothetical protein
MERAESTILTHPGLLHHTAPETEFLYIRDRAQEMYDIREDYKVASLKSSVEDLTPSTGTCTFLGKRQRDFPSVASSTIKVSSNLVGKNLKSGLAVYKDEFRFAQICYSYSTHEVILGYKQQNLAKFVEFNHTVPVAETIDLKIDASETKYIFPFDVRLEIGL